MPSVLEDGLVAMVELQEAAGIEHVVTGSIAASGYGVIRATHDVDLKVFGDDLENAMERVRIPAAHERFRRG